MSHTVWSVQTEGGKKGRKFSAVGLGSLSRDTRYGVPAHPLWTLFAAEDGAMGPVLANILMGRKVEIGSRGSIFEFPRSHGYAHRVQRVGGGVSVATVYREDLFRLNPGPIDPTVTVNFVAMPDDSWVADCGLSEKARIAAAEEALQAGIPIDFVPRLTDAAGAHYDRAPVEFLASLAPTAAYVVNYLDHRLAAPLLPGAGFALYLLVRLMASGAAQHLGVMTTSTGSYEWQCAKGLPHLPPVYMNLPHVDVVEVVGEATRAFIAD